MTYKSIVRSGLALARGMPGHISQQARDYFSTTDGPNRVSLPGPENQSLSNMQYA
jgi:hypothetical protein